MIWTLAWSGLSLYIMITYRVTVFIDPSLESVTHPMVSVTIAVHLIYIHTPAMNSMLGPICFLAPPWLIVSDQSLIDAMINVTYTVERLCAGAYFKLMLAVVAVIACIKDLSRDAHDGGWKVVHQGLLIGWLWCQWKVFIGQLRGFIYMLFS